MKQISQEYILNLTFVKALNREELLIKKYSDYYKRCNDKETKKMLKNFYESSNYHIKLLRELMMNLDIKISGGRLK